MKKIIIFLIPVLFTAGILIGCAKSEPDPDPTVEPTPEPKPSTAPTLTWEANPTFEPMLISDGMDVELAVNAPERIATFVVEIDSPTLAFALALFGLDTTLDLVYDDYATEIMSQFGLPGGDDLFGQTSVDFSLSSLVPLIAALQPDSGSEHNFTLKVTDFMGQELEQTLTFVMP